MRADVTITAGGTGYTAPPSVSFPAPIGDIEYAKLLNAHQVKTFEGNVYSWSQVLADDATEADLDLA